MSKLVDLHTHTTHSDGTLSVSELLKFASTRNISALAITDHDTVDGCKEAENINTYGVEVINGTELSCFYGDTEIHLLGFNFDIYDQRLNEHCLFFKKDRERRAIDTLNRIKKVDDRVDIDEFLEQNQNTYITRVHMAKYLISKNIVKKGENPYYKYLANEVGYIVEKYKFTVKDAIEMIKNAGGFTSIAHPGHFLTNTKLYDLIRFGMRGIEVFHPIHNKGQKKRFLSLANQYQLMVTGGSDYHGSRFYDNKNFGVYGIGEQYLAKMKKHGFDLRIGQESLF